jgi:hypothetical protein
MIPKQPFRLQLQPLPSKISQDGLGKRFVEQTIWLIGQVYLLWGVVGLDTGSFIVQQANGS